MSSTASKSALDIARLKNPRRVGDIGWKQFIGAWGLTKLPIAFEPG